MIRTAQFLVVAMVLGSVALGSSVKSPSGARKFKVDPVHTSALFCVKHLNVANFYGRFNEVTGSFSFDEEKRTIDGLEIKIKTESLDTNAEGRDTHLKSSEFFNAAEHPYIIFTGLKIKPIGKSEYKVEGEINLRGVTKPLTVTMNHTGSGNAGPRFGYRAGFETIFTLKRSDFGMTALMNFLGDEVKVILSIEASREKEESRAGGW